MQKALLSAAIALILVLVTALVGPPFVDWGRYRKTFESEISRLTRLDVRIDGPIDMRLLPTPTLQLQRVAVGRPGDPLNVRAEALRIELALGALMRGQFLASDVALEAPEISLGFDGAERLEWAASPFAFDPDAVSIAHLTIEKGRITVAGQSDHPLTLDRLGFAGEVRSLLGPAKGDGSVVVNGESYLFSIATDRATAGGTAKVRLLVDSVDHIRIGDVDSTIWIERGIPQVAGTVQWSQAQGFKEPWRVSAKLRGNWAAMVLEGISLQYGPEDRAIQLRGQANLTFRAQPQLDVTLAAARIDLDRMLAMPAPVRRRPVVAMRAVADNFGLASLPSMRVNLGLSADVVALADAQLQRVSASLRGDGGTWELDSLELLAPGGTQLQLRGRLDLTTRAPAFAGQGRIDAKDSRALVSWLTAGTGADAFAGPFRAEGDLRLGAESIAFDRFKAEFDRDSLEGSFAYFGPSTDRPGRISAALSASHIDLPRAYAFVQRVMDDTGLARPSEGSLSLNVLRASIDGIEARGMDIGLRFDERALAVERLAIDDLGGTRVAATGGIDIRTLAPRGTIALDPDIRAPDGLTAVVEKFSAPAAAALRGNASRLLPARLQASLASDAQAVREAGMDAGTGFKISGSAGAFAFDLRGVAETANDGSLPATFAQLGSAKAVVAGRIDARDGRTLVEAVGLDGLVSVDDRAGRLDFKASGRFAGPIAATAQVTAGGLDLSIDGTVQAGGQNQAATANLALSVGQANVRVPQTGTLPTTLKARLNYQDGAITLDQMTGVVAGSAIAGRLTVGLSQPASLDGDIKLGSTNLPAVIATALGAPAKRAGTARAWSADPFAGGILGQFRGRIALATARTVLTSKLAAENLHGVLTFGQSDVALEDFEADIAGGRASGRLALERNGDELGVRSRVRLANADMAALLPGDGGPISGRLNFDAEIEGRGRSPVGLIGSLQGKTSFDIPDGKIARLDPTALNVVIRSVDEGLPIEAARIREGVEAALARGALSVQGDGAITTAAGKASLTITRLQAAGADLAVSARYDVATEALDARLTLVGPSGSGDAEVGRPQIAISLQGPIDAPRRTLDIAGFSDWLSTRAIAQNAKRLAALSARPGVGPIESQQMPPTASPPSGPANSVEGAKPLPAPDAVKPDASAIPPNSPKPEPAASAVAAAKPEAPVNPPMPANPATDVPVATKPVPSVEPAPAARNPAAVGIPGEAKLPPAEAPVDPAIAALNRAIAANPNDVAALARRGQIFAVRGNYGSAIRDFDEVIRLRSQDAEAFNNRCWARAVIGDLQAALNDCNTALQLSPRYADAFDSRGMINLKSGQLVKAIADYDAALRINPKLASSLYGRGIAKIKNNDPRGNLDIAEAKSIRANIAEEFAGYGIR